MVDSGVMVRECSRPRGRPISDRWRATGAGGWEGAEKALGPEGFSLDKKQYGGMSTEIHVMLAMPPWWRTMISEPQSTVYCSIGRVPLL